MQQIFNTHLYKLLLLFVLLAVTKTYGQEWQWSRKGGGTGADRGNGICVDAEGNSYVIGQFTGQASFGNTILAPTSSVNNFSPDAIFMAKYNVLGALVWAKKVSDSNLDLGQDIALDGQGNIYVTGGYSGTVQFGGLALTSTGFGDMFLAKYNPEGTLIWAKKAGGSSFTLANSLAVDEIGNCYVTGYFRAAATFGNFTLTSTGKDNLFIAKFDGSGNVVWAKNAGGVNSSAESYDIALDKAGNSYITGVYYGPILFENLALPASSVQGNLADTFIAKYNPVGSVLWARKVQSLQEDYPAAIKADKDGNCYITGIFKGTAQFGTLSIQSNGPEYDIFITKYNSVGQELWAKKVGGPNADEAADVAIGENNAIFITGNFRETATFDQTSLNSAGEADVFVLELSPAGAITFIKQAGGLASDEVRKLALDQKENIYLTGNFRGTSTFGNFNLTSAGENDFFVAKFGLPFTGVSRILVSPFKNIDLCANSKASVIFNASGPFDSDNIFTVQLSDASGSFVFPITIGSSKNSPVAVVIPSNIPSGSGYEIRIVASSPAISSEETITNFTINSPSLIIKIPNIITPNGDGLNDAFAPEIPCLSPELKVYNRWGKLIFKQAEYQNNWAGENAPAGTYYYYLSANDQTWKGWLEVIK